MVEGSALMVTGTGGPMQQQSQLLSMYVNNAAAQGQLQQQMTQ